MRLGRRGCNWASLCWNCCARTSRSRRKILQRPMKRAAAQAGWSVAHTSKRCAQWFSFGIGSRAVGMGLAGLTGGSFRCRRKIRPRPKQIEGWRSICGRNLRSRSKPRRSRRGGRSLHDALMDACGWPEIPFDGRLLVSQQDALLLGGKVQAVPGFADHVVFRDRHAACVRGEDLHCDVLGAGAHARRRRASDSSARSAFTAAHVCGTVRSRPMANVEYRVRGGCRRTCIRGKLRKQLLAESLNLEERP